MRWRTKSVSEGTPEQKHGDYVNKFDTNKDASNKCENE